jgi:hypothetical protein
MVNGRQFMPAGLEQQIELKAYSELESNAAWRDILDQIGERIAQHEITLHKGMVSNTEAMARAQEAIETLLWLKGLPEQRTRELRKKKE